MSLPFEAGPKKRNGPSRQPTSVAVAPFVPLGPLRSFEVTTDESFRAAGFDMPVETLACLKCMTPYTPKQNGLNERFVGNFKEEGIWQHQLGRFEEAW